MLQTSDYLIIIAALLCMILSVVLWFTESSEAGLFIAIWVPTILGFGAYFKILGYRGKI